jgi:hypothetical protein
MTDFSISTPHHQLKSYLAPPEGEGPWPAKEGYLAARSTCSLGAAASVVSAP